MSLIIRCITICLRSLHLPESDGNEESEQHLGVETWASEGENLGDTIGDSRIWGLFFNPSR